MTNLKEKTVCIVDNGLFVDFARMLASSFRKVYYYSPWSQGFPTTRVCAPGNGFPEIERVMFPFFPEFIDKVDLWVFLDLYHGDLQLLLERNGCRVFGARAGEELELYRWEFKQYLKKVGLPVQHVERIVGLGNLREYLKKVKNVYVKSSIVRGDFETFRHDSYVITKPRLDELDVEVGPVESEREFVVEDEIKEAVEVGYDGFCIDGQYPGHAMMAYEVKDVGMIGVVKAYDQLAKPVLDVNKAIAATLKSYRYRGFLSTEIRYTTRKEPYFIDPCCRLGTPSNELLQELFDNWAQVLWDGAEGIITSPKPKDKFGVLATIHSEWAVGHWCPVTYPKEIDRFVKLRYHYRDGEGKDWVAPQPVGMPDVGAVVATGKTLLEAISLCKERASLIKGQQIEVTLEAIDRALETIKRGEQMGIKFAEGLPTAEQVRKA